MAALGDGHRKDGLQARARSGDRGLAEAAQQGIRTLKRHRGVLAFRRSRALFREPLRSGECSPGAWS